MVFNHLSHHHVAKHQTSHPPASSQREALLGAPSYASGKLEEGLAEAFLAVEQRMKDASARHELYCLREGK
jgi:hypothetical protein